MIEQAMEVVACNQIGSSGAFFSGLNGDMMDMMGYTLLVSNMAGKSQNKWALKWTNIYRRN